jgi:hypothetical protein
MSTDKGDESERVDRYLVLRMQEIYTKYWWGHGQLENQEDERIMFCFLVYLRHLQLGVAQCLRISDCIWHIWKWPRTFNSLSSNVSVGQRKFLKTCQGSRSPDIESNSGPFRNLCIPRWMIPQLIIILVFLLNLLRIFRDHANCFMGFRSFLFLSFPLCVSFFYPFFLSFMVPRMLTSHANLFYGLLLFPCALKKSPDLFPYLHVTT